jgi:aminoglycoside phosphotransferase (APT) family kinase protein
MKKTKESSSYQKYLEEKHKSFSTSDDLIDRVVKKAAGFTPVEKKKVIAGEVNEVYQVETEGGKLIVRISRTDKTSFETEAGVIEKVRKVGVPAPKILLVEEAIDKGATITFCVEEKIEGVPFKDLMKSTTSSDIQKITSQAGNILGKIHSIPVATFGPMDAPDLYPSWEEFIFSVKKKERTIKLAAKIVQLPTSYIKQAYEILNDHLRFFACAAPVLLHGDFSPKHWLVKEGNIEGIIDFEDAKGGDPVKDFAWLNFYYGESIPLERLMKGYGNKKLFDDSFDLKMKLYRIHHGLDILNYYYGEQNVSGLNFAKNNLITEIKNFQ